ncbi:MAG: hypothetical protein IE936_10585, partial [Moraxella osloensis]|nr:hypothetical protein [Moraxella osloensis]
MPNIRHLALGFLWLGVSSLTFAAQPPIMAAPPIVALMPLVSDNPDYFEFTPEQQLGLDEIRQGVGQ